MHFIVCSGTSLNRKLIASVSIRITKACLPVCLSFKKYSSAALVMEGGYLMEFVQWGVVETVKAEQESSVRAHILPALQCWLMSLG